MNPKFYTIKQFADAVAVKPHMIYQMIKRGDLRTVPGPGPMMLRESDLQVYHDNLEARRIPKGWIDVVQAAAKFKVHYNTIYRWIRLGKLDSKHVGRAIYIDPKTKK